MNSYYCIVTLPFEPVAELCVLDAADDGDARRKARQTAAEWPVAACVPVYQGERLIEVLTGREREDS